ncbi:Sodium/calcium exchanger protein-domain-containing protein [Hyaloraphidium curvatum]|nr:Sodium/calcium exchanger protein-domain-containing protein [Hyaloraphidium curvatum]
MAEADETAALLDASRPPLIGALGRSRSVARREDTELPPLGQQLYEVATNTWINALLVFVPLGLLAEWLHWGDVAVFTLNFFAIVPLAKLLGFATEEIALRTSQAIGGLLNATFGNAVELIIGAIALNQGLLPVVQASILGSVLSNLLLVLGLSFLCGGIYFKEQKFNSTAAGTAASLMTMSVLGMILPAAFHAQASKDDPTSAVSILDISHYTALILLCIYVLYLIFQLGTHAHLYAEEADVAEHAEDPAIGPKLALGLLVGATVLVALCAEGLVGAIEGVSEKAGMGTMFVGFILLPLVGNAAEHLTAVTVAMKNKMELSIGVALGSSIQIALLVGPLLVVIGWIIGQPLTFDFGTFETIVAFVAIIFTNGVVVDGVSNWLEGAMLLGAYVVVAVTHWYLPDPPHAVPPPIHNGTMVIGI